MDKELAHLIGFIVQAGIVGFLVYAYLTTRLAVYAAYLAFAVLMSARLLVVSA